MDIVYFMYASRTTFFAIPLLIVAIGGMYSERSGVINIALEGIMVIGAFGRCSFYQYDTGKFKRSGTLLISHCDCRCYWWNISPLLHAFALY